MSLRQMLVDDDPAVGCLEVVASTTPLRTDRPTWSARSSRPSASSTVCGTLSPVSACVSRTYRQSFHSFASPWWFSRSPVEIVRTAPLRLLRAAVGRPGVPPPGRKDEYLARQARFYPTSASTLQLRG